jgi:hypothetical protein
MTRVRAPEASPDLDAPEEKAAPASPESSPVAGPRQVLAREPERDDLGCLKPDERVVHVGVQSRPGEALFQGAPGRAVVVADGSGVHVIGEQGAQRELQSAVSAAQ